MKRTLLILLISFLSWESQAQWCADTTHAQSHSHAFSVAQVAVPSLMIGSGVALHTVPALKSLNQSIRDGIVDLGMPHCKIDDYLMFLPSVSVAGLNLMGLPSAHSFKEIAILMGETYLAGEIIVLTIKNNANLQRPDGTSWNTFPSGHTFTAFVGAEMLRREYGKDYPGIAIAGYGVATFIGGMRLYNNRHWMADILAGAGLGILTTSAVYWINSNHRLTRLAPLPGGVAYNL